MGIAKKEKVEKPVEGTWMYVMAVLKKGTETNYDDRGRVKWPVIFKRYREELEQPVRMMYIGYSVVHEGYHDVDVEYGEYGSILSQSKYFAITRSFTIYRFVKGGRSKVYEVLPEDIATLLSDRSVV